MQVQGGKEKSHKKSIGGSKRTEFVFGSPCLFCGAVLGKEGGGGGVQRGEERARG